MAGKHVSRRNFLRQAFQAGGGIAVLATLGVVALRRHDLGAASGQSSSTIITNRVSSNSKSPFVSRPDLNPPHISLTREASWVPAVSVPGSYFLIAPKPATKGVHSQFGLMIVDDRGEPVWFQPSSHGETLTDLQVQSYRGKPVLTWWQGTGVEGHGLGVGYIADETYQTIATIKAGNGLSVDGHELSLTPHGTALVTSYYTTTGDLSAMGGPKVASITTCQAQEIDVATGKLLFAWNSIDHVGVEESYKSIAGVSSHDPFDYFHMNSVSLAPDGDLLISARNTWAVYKVSRKNGSVVWRIGGKKSDFAMGSGTPFYWQHDARALTPTRISLFDDGAGPPEEFQSRGLVLQLNTKTMACELVRAYVHPTRLLASSQGNVQVLTDGRVVVGWGNEPYFSEFMGDGHIVLDGRMPTGLQSYRAFRSNWRGRPTAKPDIAVRQVGQMRRVYSSWNGDTQVTQWRVLAGATASQLSDVATSTRSGFETATDVATTGPYFAVEALGANGATLATSSTVQMT